jgi:uncharacterized membrane protein YfcA
MDAKLILIAALIAITIFYAVVWFTMARRKHAAEEHGHHEPVRPTVLQTAIGFVTNFFDTLGIGSFATTTAMFRAWKLVPDEQIPGTLNVGHVLPTVVQAVIYTTIVEVEFTTLVLMIAAACAGAWLGAGLVAGWPRRKIQVGMGSLLFVAAGLLLITAIQESSRLTAADPPRIQILPLGGDALGLEGTKMAIGIAGNFVLGALMTLGIGLYAPCMILISLLGMSPRTAFPIMMGSCAFLMPVGSLQFVRKNSYNLRAALGLALGGPLAVLIAAYIVQELPINSVRWLVVVVVIYTAATMLRAAASERKAAEARADMTHRP